LSSFQAPIPKRIATAESLSIAFRERQVFWLRCSYSHISRGRKVAGISLKILIFDSRQEKLGNGGYVYILAEQLYT
jgi:hypothetical protein